VAGLESGVGARSVKARGKRGALVHGIPPARMREWRRGRARYRARGAQVRRRADVMAATRVTGVEMAPRVRRGVIGHGARDRGAVRVGAFARCGRGVLVRRGADVRGAMGERGGGGRRFGARAHRVGRERGQRDRHDPQE
jgi:hypothetical protein